jgi:hypothetical protein
VEIDYGINRKMDSGNFFDVYFGEFLALAKDLFNAPGLVNKFLYLIMPPGWHHSGEHKTATIVRDNYLENIAIQD